MDGLEQKVVCVCVCSSRLNALCLSTLWCRVPREICCYVHNDNSDIYYVRENVYNTNVQGLLNLCFVCTRLWNVYALLAILLWCSSSNIGWLPTSLVSLHVLYRTVFDASAHVSSVRRFKVVAVLNSTSVPENPWNNGGIAPCILNLDTTYPGTHSTGGCVRCRRVVLGPNGRYLAIARFMWPAFSQRADTKLASRSIWLCHVDVWVGMSVQLHAPTVLHLAKAPLLRLPCVLFSLDVSFSTQTFFPDGVGLFVIF